jgi:hypothetical protein
VQDDAQKNAEIFQLTPAVAVRICTDIEPVCRECRRMLARKLTRPWVIDCPRCRVRNSR